MTARSNNLSPLQRKQLLVQQGALYRAGVSESMQSVQENLHPDALTRNALGYAGRHVWPGISLLVGQALRKEGALAALTPVLIPLAKGGWSWLKRRPVRTTLLRSLTIALPVAALAYLAYKKVGSRANAGADAKKSGRTNAPPSPER